MLGEFFKNKGCTFRLSIIIGFCALFLIYYFQLSYASPYAASWDQVDFALALKRYDLLAMQPHFPGYPYFILGGTFVNQFVNNPAQALAIFNSIMMLSATVPIYLLAKRYQTFSQAWLTTALIQSSSYMLLIVTQPMSEGAAMAAFWWYGWSLHLAKENRKFLFQIIPLFLFSIVLGIRLSYLPFVSGILLLWWHEWKILKSWKRLFILCSFAVFFQLIWLFAVMASEGGVISFFKLALSFTNGHFHEWGGTAATDDHSFLQRALTLIFYNIIWTGICSQSFLILFLYTLLLFFIYLKRLTLKADAWLAMMGIVYFIWALFGQNIDKPRHVIPVAAIILFYLWSYFWRTELTLKKMVFATVVLTVQITIGAVDMKKQSDSLPATYQLAYDLEDKREEFVLYTWEETRVLNYLQVNFPHQEVYRFNIFLQGKSNYKHATIYLTDHVLKGFAEQGINIENRVKKVRKYKSSKLSDPVYGEITLYKWID
ncbi:nucleoporin-interacting protein [Bacillus songklensis]|uniref:Nucleoporin-interacting protein n=1 Tax=Bacillus songklensis TaxID=1069116 RepID=A0ABV8AYV6_9BACI